jgi:hypothetical protein
MAFIYIFVILNIVANFFILKVAQYILEGARNYRFFSIVAWFF